MRKNGESGLGTLAFASGALFLKQELQFKTRVLWHPPLLQVCCTGGGRTLQPFQEGSEVRSVLVSVLGPRLLSAQKGLCPVSLLMGLRGLLPSPGMLSTKARNWHARCLDPRFDQVLYMAPRNSLQMAPSQSLWLPNSACWQEKSLSECRL